MSAALHRGPIGAGKSSTFDVVRFAQIAPKRGQLVPMVDLLDLFRATAKGRARLIEALVAKGGA